MLWKRRTITRAFLVVHWWRICLSVQGTWVQSLAWEDPVYHAQLSLCATAAEPENCNSRSPRALEPALHSKTSRRKESPGRRRKWQPTPILLLGKFHGQRSLVGYSPWDHEESDTTEHSSTWLTMGWWEKTFKYCEERPHRRQEGQRQRI